MKSSLFIFLFISLSFSPPSFYPTIQLFSHCYFLSRIQMFLLLSTFLFLQGFSSVSKLTCMKNKPVRNTEYRNKCRTKLNSVPVESLRMFSKRIVLHENWTKELGRVCDVHIPTVNKRFDLYKQGSNHAFRAASEKCVAKQIRSIIDQY